MSPTTYRHGVLSNRVGHIITIFIDEHPEVGGAVVGAETGFRINDSGHPVQAPDAGYVRAGRAPDETGSEEDLDHFMDGAPDLAVEVQSPGERTAALRAKAERWLAAGTGIVWVVNGRRETVQVWTIGARPTSVAAARA